MSNNIWFTSDTHWNHSSIIRYTNRPFANVCEMNEALIENWNSVVDPKDTIYHIGDFGIGNTSDLLKIFNKLNGCKFLVKGNHDKKNVYNLPWQHQYQQKGLTIGKDYIWMCHYPMRSWNRSYHGSFHVYGHVHSQCKVYGKSLDVGSDSWDYTPVNFETLKYIFDRVPKLNPEFDCLFYQNGEMFNGNKLLENIRKNDEKEYSSS